MENLCGNTALDKVMTASYFFTSIRAFSPELISY